MNHAERAARNEAIFREVNENIRSISNTMEAREPEFLCECSSVSCSERIRLSIEEYEAVRARGARFALVAGHSDLAVERVVETHDDYVVVEKFGEAAEVAQKLDPRE